MCGAVRQNLHHGPRRALRALLRRAGREDLQHFPLAGEGFTPEECYSAAVAMAVSLPQGRSTRSARACTERIVGGVLTPPRGAEDAAPTVEERFIPHGRVKTLPYKSPIKIPFANSIAHRRELW